MQTKTRKIIAITTGALLAIALAVAAIAAIPANITTLTQEQLPVVTATATAKMSVKPDVAYIYLGVTTVDADSASACTANGVKMDGIIKALEGVGVKAEDISTSNVSMYPRYDYSDGGDGKITGYEVSNSITVTTHDVDNAGKIVNVGMSSGANNLNGVSYDVESSEDIYQKALAQAVVNAQAKASIMAEAAGKKLGDIVNINEGSDYYSPYNSNVYAGNAMMAKAEAAAADGGIGDTLKPGNIEITAQVTSSYALLAK